MTLQERIRALVRLGEKIKNLTEEEFMSLADRVEHNNNWFTPEQTRISLHTISAYLDEASMLKWLEGYTIPENTPPRSIGLMMAGNIPAVGFHDLLCILISGHKAYAKLSSTDQVLIRWLSNQLIQIHPGFGSRIFFEEMLKGKDAYIATGSDNSSRYFEYYFGQYPSIIRKNRTSVAILNGDEETDDYKALGHDIFQYFGLGCRNVSKLYLKDEEQLQYFLKAIEGFHFLTSHHKYLNNYEYNKAIYLVNGDKHLDNGFLLLQENEQLVSPIAVLYFEYYSHIDDLKQKISHHQSKIQCVVSKDGWYPSSLPFGKAQQPSLWDYADHIDTLNFLINLQ
jgi:hypothetical protein